MPNLHVLTGPNNKFGPRAWWAWQGSFMFPEPGYMPVLVMCGPRSLPQVESLVFGTDLEDAEVLQRHMMVQMLMERRILEEETDRGSNEQTFFHRWPWRLLDDLVYPHFRNPPRQTLRICWVSLECYVFLNPEALSFLPNFSASVSDVSAFGSCDTIPRASV